MKHSTYTSYDELPLMLSVAEVASVLGISRAGAFQNGTNLFTAAAQQ